MDCRGQLTDLVKVELANYLAMARFSAATLLLILVGTVSVYTCSTLAGAALGRTLASSTRTRTKHPPARDIALRVSVSLRGLAEDFAKELWRGNHREGRRSGGAGGDGAEAALSSPAARASVPLSRAELQEQQRQAMLAQIAYTNIQRDIHEEAAAARARPVSRHRREMRRGGGMASTEQQTARPSSRALRNFSGEISEGTKHGERGVVKVGPWGGSGGLAFSMPGSGGGPARLLSVFVEHTDAVHGFSYEYLQAGVRRTSGPPDGHRYAPKGIGPVVTTGSTIEFSSDEQLTAVEGTFGRWRGGWAMDGQLPEQVVVTSLTFHTDKGETYGPYGEETGTPFSIPAANGCIVGFWGRSGWLLDAIGVYITPCDAQRSCGKSDITFTVRKTGNVVGRQPEYVVAIRTSCSCPMKDVRVWCGGLENSAVPLDASRVEVDDGMCVVKQPVAKGSPVIFTYSCEVPVNFRVFNAAPDC
ncbi:hypothetical protein QYE76_015861 [Lolium multiflorum]|uniref:Jacalin-type lectin domain-containing protein n=1 Tax=Lolium multiflorum TaxID=4521 RepID=A0AAD8U8W3_LOLMU|nr:hypothetical protein QYE76_015861 [Lolium multiflorum]